MLEANSVSVLMIMAKFAFMRYLVGANEISNSISHYWSEITDSISMFKHISLILFLCVVSFGIAIMFVLFPVGA